MAVLPGSVRELCRVFAIEGRSRRDCNARPIDGADDREDDIGFRIARVLSLEAGAAAPGAR